MGREFCLQTAMSTHLTSSCCPSQGFLSDPLCKHGSHWLFLRRPRLTDTPTLSLPTHVHGWGAGRRGPPCEGGGLVWSWERKGHLNQGGARSTGGFEGWEVDVTTSQRSPRLWAEGTSSGSPARNRAAGLEPRSAHLTNPVLLPSTK